jgi:hypothetical protein
MTMGPVSSTPDLVLSVPEPDISLRFLIQLLKQLIQHLAPWGYSIA